MPFCPGWRRRIQAGRCREGRGRHYKIGHTPRKRIFCGHWTETPECLTARKINERWPNRTAVTVFWRTVTSCQAVVICPDTSPERGKSYSNNLWRSQLGKQLANELDAKPVFQLVVVLQTVRWFSVRKYWRVFLMEAVTAVRYVKSAIL